MFHSYGLSHTGRGQHGSVLILSAYSGSIHLSQYTTDQVLFVLCSGIGWFADEYESAMIGDPFAATVIFEHPPEPFGRHYFRVDAHNKSFDLSFPIWVLLILWALSVFAIHQLLRRRLLREANSTSICIQKKSNPKDSFE
jgi:hypothetical protein